MDLKKALLISFVGHCFVLSPLGNLGIFLPAKREKEVQVTYYKIKSAEPESPKNPVEIKKIAEPVKTPPKPAPLPKVDPKNPRQRIVKKIEPAKPVPQKPPLPAKENIAPASIPGTTLPNTPECLTYYHYIRGEIRRYLEKHYKPEYEEGEVFVAFILNRSGDLVDLKVIEQRSSKDPTLNRLARESIREASPFKSFPKGLELTQISFSLTVVFKKR